MSDRSEVIDCPGCGDIYDPKTPFSFMTWMLRHEEHFEEATA